MARALPFRRGGSKSATHKRLRPYERVQIEISLCVLILVLLLTLFPIFYILMTSLNSSDGFPRTLIPDHFTLDHYSYVLQSTGLLTWLRNTLIVGVVTGSMQVVLVTLLAYSCSRFMFRRRQYGMLALLALQI